MTDGIIALCFGAGVGAWAWAQLSRQTGNANAQHVLIGAGVAGLIAFFFLFTLFKWVLHIG